MKLANVIIPAKEFLFDTWYGALTVWCGASALLVAMLLLDLPFAGRIWWSSIAPYVGYALLLLLLIAGLVFIAAWIVSLVKRRWQQAIVQLALGVIGFAATMRRKVAAVSSASWRVDAQTMAQRTAHAFPATSSATGAKKLFSETRKMPRSFGSM